MALPNPRIGLGHRLGITSLSGRLQWNPTQLPSKFDRPVTFSKASLSLSHGADENSNHNRTKSEHCRVDSECALLKSLIWR